MISPDVKTIIRGAAFAELQRVIRDAFLEGRDQDAMRILDSQEYRTLKTAEDVNTRTLVGINSYGMVAAGAYVTITARPQTSAFRVTKVLVSPSCAAYFTINDLRVGNRSQLPTSGDVAADLFAIAPSLEWTVAGDSPNPKIADLDGREISYSISITAQGELAIGQEMNFETCFPSQDLVLMATNISGRAAQFRGAFVGYEVSEERRPY